MTPHRGSIVFLDVDTIDGLVMIGPLPAHPIGEPDHPDGGGRERPQGPRDD